MAAQEIFYGKLQPQDFILVDSTGARVPDHIWVPGDANLHIDGAAAIDVYASMVHISNGLYTYTPASIVHTTGKRITLLLKDTNTSSFLDDALKFVTGGHVDAYFNATGN